MGYQTDMHRRLFLFIVAVGLVASGRADDAVSAARWSLQAECQMLVMPQKLALPLIADLSDDAKIEAAWAAAQQMIARGDATLAANLVLNGEAGKALLSESVEELRYATEFDPPQLPQDVPKEKIAEVLKNWPVIGITPTNFETRNLGAMLELNATVSDDGEWISADVTPQHVRLLRMDKFDAGTMPSGEHLTVEQPQFLALKSTLKMHLRSRQRTLVGVHKLPGDENKMELFILRVTARKTGGVK